jgi:hypothetical protein
VKYNTIETFYARLASLSFPFLSFHIIFSLTSTGQTCEPNSMVDDSNDAFPRREVPFWVSLKTFDFTGSVTPKTTKRGRGPWFPSETSRINKNSYPTQIKRYRQKISTLGGN